MEEKKDLNNKVTFFLFYFMFSPFDLVSHIVHKIILYVPLIYSEKNNTSVLFV